MNALAEFTGNLARYLKPPDIERIEEAYQFSGKAHDGQFRDSGEPYISHPLAVVEPKRVWTCLPADRCTKGLPRRPRSEERRVGKECCR